MFKNKRYKDLDGNGIGEYAIDFEEMTGNNNSGHLNPEYVGRSLINMVPRKSHLKQAEKNGYIFQFMALPKAKKTTTTNMAEEHYVCIAWPKIYDKTGNACYFITESGILFRYANQDSTFDGYDKMPKPEDIYSLVGDPSTIGQGTADFIRAK